MMDERVGIDWKGWLGWIVTTMVGVDVVVIIVYITIFGVVELGIRGAVTEDLVLFAAVTVAGLLYGGLQWMWWRKRMLKSKRWIVATLVGWYMGIGTGVLLSLIGLDTDKFSGWRKVATIILLFGTMGVAASLPQWWVVRQQFVRSWFWLVARPLGLLAGVGLISLVESLHLVALEVIFGPSLVFNWNVSLLTALCALFGMFGVALGVISGGAVIWMERQPEELAIAS